MDSVFPFTTQTQVVFNYEYEPGNEDGVATEITHPFYLADQSNPAIVYQIYIGFSSFIKNGRLERLRIQPVIRTQETSVRVDVCAAVQINKRCHLIDKGSNILYDGDGSDLGVGCEPFWCKFVIGPFKRDNLIIVLTKTRRFEPAYPNT